MPVEAYPTGLDVGDLDGDGHVDAVVRDSDGVAVFHGAGDGTLSLFDYLPADRGSGQVVISDLTADGVPDLVVTGLYSEIFTVYDGVGDGSLVERSTLASPGGPWNVKAADLNHDGRPDHIMSVNHPDAGIAVSWAICD